MVNRVFLTLALLTVSLVSVTAQDQPKEGKDEKPDPAAEAVALVTNAAALVEYGRKTKSPEALITAAGMLKRVPPSTLLKAEPEQGELAEGSGQLPSLREEADARLAEAKKLANNDKTIVALADMVANRKVSRGAYGGPRLVQNALYPKSRYTLKVRVVAGTPMALGVTGAGNVPLKVVARFYAQGHNILITDSTGFVGSHTFHPPVNGYLHITVTNPTNAGTSYRIATN